jgi:hypothetical protein
MLPLTVLDEVVDSVEVVRPVGNELFKDASNDGDTVLAGSSLMGETLRMLKELRRDEVRRARC